MVGGGCGDECIEEGFQTALPGVSAGEQDAGVL